MSGSRTRAGALQLVRRYINRHKDLSAVNLTLYLVYLETPPFHSSMFGAGYFWDSGLQLKVGSLSFSKFCPFIAISRDHSSEGNCIELDSESGEPIVNYSITREDELNLLHGLVSI